MKVLKIKKSAYSHLSINQNSNIAVPRQGTRVAVCKRIFSYFEIVAGKLQPPHDCPEAITITIQKYKVVRKCIENITLTIPVSLKIDYWSGWSQILFILSTSVHGPNKFAKNLNLGQNLQVRFNGLRFGPKYCTELRRRHQWKSSTSAEWDITFCSGQQRDWVTWRKERLTRAQAHPPNGLQCVLLLSCTGVKTTSSCVIALPPENVFLVEFLSFRKHLFRTSSSSRMNGFESRFATESMHRAINRVRISSSREWQEFLEY